MAEKTFEKIVVGFIVSFVWISCFAILATAVFALIDFINNLGGF